MTEPSTESLLVLLAVQLLGGDKVSKKSSTVAALKNFIARSIEEGLLVEETIRPLTKSGRPGRPTPVLSISSVGKELIEQSVSPAIAATRAAASAAALVHSVDSDRAALREQLMKAYSDRSAELKAISKVVGDVAAKLANWEAALSQHSVEEELKKFDKAFQTIMARVVHTHVDPPAAAPTPRSAPQALGSPPSSLGIREGLHAAYSKLVRFIDYQDGLVDLPALYHEAKKILPDLTVTAMHRELAAMWESRTLELKVLNEVHKAADRDKGIWRNEKLYYYVIWKQS